MTYVITSAKTVEEAVEKALKELNSSKEEVKVEIIEEPSKGLFGLLGQKDATVKVTIEQDASDFVKKILDESFDQPKQNKKVETEAKVETEKRETKQKIEPKLQAEKQIVESNKESETTKEEKINEAEILEKAQDFLCKVVSETGIEYSISTELKDNVLYAEIKSPRPETLGIVIGKRGVTLDSIQYLLSLIINKGHREYIRVFLDSNNYRKKREKTLINLAHKMAEKAKRSGRNIKLEPMNPYERRIIHSALTDNEEIETYSEGRDPYRRVVINLKK